MYRSSEPLSLEDDRPCPHGWARRMSRERGWG
jgi:hypothetical protein